MVFLEALPKILMEVKYHVEYDYNKIIQQSQQL